MTAILRIFPLKVWVGIGVVALILALYGAYRFQEARANRAVAEARQATATADALDKVATETPAIRDDQKDRENEVSTIPGAETRLPDNFGRDLERVRQRPANRNP
jgi:hypothetical protein